MTIRHQVALAVITLVLFLQFVLPAAQWFSDGPNRWGWQMYSRAPRIPEITAVYAGGELEPINLDDLVYRQRYELRYDAETMDQLCERIPNASRLILEYVRPREVIWYPCGN